MEYSLEMNRHLGTKWFTFYTRVRPWLACLTTLTVVLDFFQHMSTYFSNWWLLFYFMGSIAQAGLSIAVAVKSDDAYADFVRFVKGVLLFETINMAYGQGVQQYFQNGLNLKYAAISFVVVLVISYFVWYRLNAKYFEKRLMRAEDSKTEPERIDAAAKEKPAEPEAVVKSKQKVICPKCNRELAKTNKFCQYCGSRIATDSEQPETSVKNKNPSNGKKTVKVLLIIAVVIAVLTTCILLAMPGKTEPGVTTVPPTTIPATTAPKESPLVGSYSNNVYTNEFLGITCQLNADWTVFNEEQLAQLAGLTADLMDNEALKEQMEKGTAIYAFYGQAQGGQVNMNIVLERLSLINGILLDEKGYVEIAKDQLIKGLESVGLENVTAEIVTLQFAGKEHAGIRIHGTMQGVELYETIACVKNGNYIASVVTASVGTDTTADLLALFKPLNG